MEREIKSRSVNPRVRCALADEKKFLHACGRRLRVETSHTAIAEVEVRSTDA